MEGAGSVRAAVCPSTGNASASAAQHRHRLNCLVEQKHCRVDRSRNLARVPPLATARDGSLVSAVYWKTANSYASGLNDHDRTVFQVHFHSGKIRSKQRQQVVRVTVQHASKEDYRWSRCQPKSKQCPEVRILGKDSPILRESEVEQRTVACGLQPYVPNVDYIVTIRSKSVRQPRRQRVIDKQPQAGWSNGRCRSSTAAAAKRSAASKSSGSKSG